MLCYSNFEQWPPNGADIDERYEVCFFLSSRFPLLITCHQVEYEHLANGLTLIGITGIKDSFQDGIREAVANRQKAGVQVKMCTGDNVFTTRPLGTPRRRRGFLILRSSRAP